MQTLASKTVLCYHTKSFMNTRPLYPAQLINIEKAIPAPSWIESPIYFSSLISLVENFVLDT